MSLKEIVKNAQGVPTGEYKNIAGGTMYADSPIGSILPYGGTTAPTGWMICNGASLLRADYPELFAVIGTAFGSADSTHFNIPDLREVVPVGAGTSDRSAIATHDAYTLGQFKDDQFQSHTHNYMTIAQDSSADLAVQAANIGQGYKYSNLRTTTSTTPTGRNSTATHGKQLGVNYIIKAKMVALPADLEAQLDVDYQKKDLTSAVEGATTVEGALGALSTNKLQLYTYEITDKSTDANGNMPCGYASSLGIPINFKPYLENNYPCNAFIDQAGMIYVRPLNHSWGINDYGSVANFNLKGTLYCVK